jgi:uncharacterized protein YndB with AHSA1/START domain
MKNNLTGKVSISIQAEATEVWDALTKPSMIKQYFYGTDTITNWKEGSPIVFKGEWEGKSYEDKGTILNIEPGKLLRYKYWSSLSGIEDKPENYIPVTYALSEGNNKTTLTVTQENIPTEKMKAHSEKNWKQVLNNLKKLLEKRTVNF